MLVIRNEMSAGTKEFSLEPFELTEADHAQVYQTSPEHNMEQLQDIPVYANGLKVEIGDNSITTVVLEGVHLKSQ
ncbi:hypothetical protein D3C75_1320130 [compost metagenome]